MRREERLDAGNRARRFEFTGQPWMPVRLPDSPEGTLSLHDLEWPWERFDLLHPQAPSFQSAGLRNPLPAVDSEAC